MSFFNICEYHINTGHKEFQTENVELPTFDEVNETCTLNSKTSTFLSDYCGWDRQIERTNSGSLVSWNACTVTNKFNYLCVAFKASIQGWLRGCRPMVGLDGGFLKRKYS